MTDQTAITIATGITADRDREVQPIITKGDRNLRSQSSKSIKTNLSTVLMRLVGSNDNGV